MSGKPTFVIKEKDFFSQRNPSSFSHQVEIKLDFGELHTAIDWCKSNNFKHWAWVPATVLYTYTFFFDDLKEANAFILRWKQEPNSVER